MATNGALTGEVKFFNRLKGYGFIVPDDGKNGDHFVHVSAVEASGLDDLQQGQKLEYELVRGRSGRYSAANLKVLP